MIHSNLDLGTQQMGWKWLEMEILGCPEDKEASLQKQESKQKKKKKNPSQNSWNKRSNWKGDYNVLNTLNFVGENRAPMLEVTLPLTIAQSDQCDSSRANKMLSSDMNPCQRGTMSQLITQHQAKPLNLKCELGGQLQYKHWFYRYDFNSIYIFLLLP